MLYIIVVLVNNIVKSLPKMYIMAISKWIELNEIILWPFPLTREY